MVAILMGSLKTSEQPVTAQYVKLMRMVYALANSSASLPLLSTNILRALFITLADDALVFLAGVWLSGASDGDALAHAALCHAVAFFAAHSSAAHPVDFQTVHPALLVALQSKSHHIREAAAECVALMARMAAAKKAEGVYMIDLVYGASSGERLPPPLLYGR